MNITTGSIVVGYDGSLEAGVALDWAAAEAQRRGSPLTVLHVLDYLTLTPGLKMSASHLPHPDAVAVEGAARARKIAPTIAIEAQTQIEKVAHSLVESSQQASLLVLGTRGHGTLIGAVLGSVAFAVSAYAACPVVIVRGDPAAAAGPGRAVVVGADGTSGSADAIRFAAAAAARSSAPLVIVTAYSSTAARAWAEISAYRGNTEGGPIFEGIAETTAAKVAAAAAEVARAAAPALEVSTKVVEGVAGEILSDSSLGCALLVVGSRGRGSLAGLMLGSVSHAVIHAASCPVAVVRGGGHAVPREKVGVVPVEVHAT